MDEITVQMKGIKPLKLQVYFLRNYIDMGAKSNLGTYRGQNVTTCILRHNGLILGIGVAVQHPGDPSMSVTGDREALKKAAQSRAFARLLSKQEIITYLGLKSGTWDKAVFSAWRKMHRDEAIAEGAE